MASKEMEKLLERVYKDIDMLDFNGKNVPRIILDDRKFDDMMSKIQGKPISVNTNLNILQDGLGHVFVEITLDFSHGDIHEELSQSNLTNCMMQMNLKLTKQKGSISIEPN